GWSPPRGRAQGRPRRRPLTPCPLWPSPFSVGAFVLPGGTMSTRLSYTIPEAAAAVGVSEWTIRAEIRANRLAARYVGSKPLIPASELEAWLESLPRDRKSTRLN